MITNFQIFEDLLTPEESYTSFSALKKYMNMKNIYVHFTDMNKLGFNPQKSHHDPYGIYFYPINFIFGEDSSVFQYGYSMKHFYICKIDTRKYLKINNINFDNIRQYFSMAGLTDVFNKINFSDFGKRNDLKLWNVIDMLNYEPDKRDAYFTTDFGKKIKENDINIYKKLPQVRWNFFFNKLGYDGIIDNNGVINMNEPKQLIVFNSKNIQILETGENKIQKNIYLDLFNELKDLLKCDNFKGEYKTKNDITYYLIKTEKDNKFINIDINFSNNDLFFYYVENNNVKVEKERFNIFGVYKNEILSTVHSKYSSCLRKSDKNKRIEDYINSDFMIMLTSIFKYYNPERVSQTADESSYFNIDRGYLKFLYKDKKYNIEYYPFEGNDTLNFIFDFSDYNDFKRKISDGINHQKNPDKVKEYLKKYSLFNINVLE